MSEINTLHHTANAKTIRIRAAAWIEKKTRDDWSEDDERAFQAWLAGSPANEIAYWRVEAVWSETYRLAAVRVPKKPVTNPTPSRRARSLVAHALVLAVVAAAVTVVATDRFKDHVTTYATGLGERKTLTFADGSQIELNTLTILRASYEDNSRKVWLEKGEAFFHVRHNASRPFSVIAAGRQITDIGTEFSVERNEGKLKIAVLEGSVRLEGTKTTPHAELTSGEVAIAYPHTLTLSRLPVEELTSRLSWRKGKLVFHHTPLNEVAAEFNRYNGEKLIVRGDNAGAITINGTFATDGTKAFSRLAQVVLGLRVETRGSTIIISR